MPKYHISPKTGRPNVCRASSRPCPIGGQNEHYESKSEARAAYESKMGDKLFNNVSKVDKPKTTLNFAALTKERDNYIAVKEKNDEMLQSYGRKKKQVLLAIADGDLSLQRGWEDLKYFDKLSAAHHEIGDELNKKIAKLNKEMRPSEKPVTDSVTHHNNRERIVEVMKVNKDNVYANPKLHYSRNAGHLNPAARTGTGSEYLDTGKNSLVILGEADGKRARVISSYGEAYSDPQKELGTPATQVKQYSGDYRDRETHGLHVLGYVSKEGKSYGWIPNKQLQFFVYK